MTDLSVDPAHLHAIAARLYNLGGDAARLVQHSSAGQGAPGIADFPQAAVGQRAGQLWDDARPVFTDGLTLLGQMLARTAGNFSAAALQYEAADQASADQIRNAGQ